MSFAAKLFSFEGRIGRGDWWMLGGLVFVVQFLVLLGIFMSQGGFGPPAMAEVADKDAMVAAASDGAGFGGFVTAVLVAAVLGLWPNLAINTKRWHDRDKGAAWMLINFIPWIGPIWATVELGLLAGTAGPNRFGPGPGQAGSLAEVFEESEEDADARAAAAIARWTQSAPTQASPMLTRTQTPAPASAGGFGKRTSAPAWG